MTRKLQVWKGPSYSQIIIGLWCAPVPFFFVALFLTFVWEESGAIFVLLVLPMPLFAGIAGGVLIFKSETQIFRRRSSAPPPTVRIAALSVGFAIAGTVASYIILIFVAWPAAIVFVQLFERFHP